MARRGLTGLRQEKPPEGKGGEAEDFKPIAGKGWVITHGCQPI